MSGRLILRKKERGRRNEELEILEINYPAIQTPNSCTDVSWCPKGLATHRAFRFGQRSLAEGVSSEETSDVYTARPDGDAGSDRFAAYEACRGRTASDRTSLQTLKYRQGMPCL